MSSFRKSLLATVAGACLLLGGGMAYAESMHEALALAYSNNPSLNAERAGVRATDELVAIAKSAVRPQVFFDADIGKSSSESTVFGTRTTTKLTPGGFGITISQTIFDGFQTLNNIEAAKAAIKASRESLRNVEQNTLFDAAAAYMDVIRDQVVAGYRAEALAFLDEQVRSENSRFEVGESTRTDVAQARGRRAAAEAQLAAARAQLQSSIAVYRQVVGKDPGGLKTPKGVAHLLPGSINGALSIAYAEHPAIAATRHLVDQALFDVKSAEGQLLPRVTLDGSLTRRYDPSSTVSQVDSAQITARLRVPIYQGGRVSAQVRQGKETLGQRRIEVDATRDNVRAAVVSAFSQLEAARSAVEANRSQLSAARLALQGAVEERRVGQRTTLDVLNTQQDVLTAQISLANSERDLIVASYAALSAVGRLDSRTLGLQVAHYDPVEHYIAVEDKWYGLRTPDGQ